MEKPACIFGDFYRKERKKQGISLWKVVHELDTYLVNVQRIEKGLTQPSLTMAFRLLQVIQTSPGDFLYDLSIEHSQQLPQSLAGQNCNDISCEKPILKNGQKSYFGPLFSGLRISAGLSQNAVANNSGYNLRNLNAVEKGLQEPRIITALSLVISAGGNVRGFFNQLYEFWINQ